MDQAGTEIDWTLAAVIGVYDANDWLAANQDPATWPDATPDPAKAEEACSHAGVNPIRDGAGDLTYMAQGVVKLYSDTWKARIGLAMKGHMVPE